MVIIGFACLDVHKNYITVAIADEGRDGEVRRCADCQSFDATHNVICKPLVDGSDLRFVCEAGPADHGLYRDLSGNGFHCVVVAPSPAPRKRGTRIKNDRRNAEMLARLLRAGELTPVHVPHPEDEAVRGSCPDTKRCEQGPGARQNSSYTVSCPARGSSLLARVTCRRPISAEYTV